MSKPSALLCEESYPVNPLSPKYSPSSDDEVIAEGPHNDIKVCKPGDPPSVPTRSDPSAVDVPAGVAEAPTTPAKKPSSTPRAPGAPKKRKKTVRKGLVSGKNTGCGVLLVTLFLSCFLTYTK